mmetsp:Transcript_5646/g.7012  ORF Transcript_5646/g.7012 Transcript_5646/m.7012 type:complete len:88 (-) Transcript_5646:718-981(-)
MDWIVVVDKDFDFDMDSNDVRFDGVHCHVVYGVVEDDDGHLLHHSLDGSYKHHGRLHNDVAHVAYIVDVDCCFLLAFDIFVVIGWHH